MKKIRIGRDLDQEIQIKDPSEKVSRKHAIITFSPLGKMTLYDTSSNGTFVNGERVEKPNGKPIRRGDEVNFAKVVDLDWDQVKDPYTVPRLIAGLLGVLVIAAVVLLIVFADDISKAWGPKVETRVDTVQRVDTIIKKVKDNQNNVKVNKKDVKKGTKGKEDVAPGLDKDGKNPLQMDDRTNSTNSKEPPSYKDYKRPEKSTNETPKDNNKLNKDIQDK